MLTTFLLILLWNVLRAFFGLPVLAPLWAVSTLAVGLSKHWLYVAVLGVTLAVPHTADAGWFSWLWDDPNTAELEQSAELAQDAARVAAQAAEAQAQQASAQAEQNSRVAETLAQLSQERQAFAADIQALSDLRLEDSKVAAVLNASGPVLVCVTVLMVTAISLWLVSRQGRNDAAELVRAMDVLVAEVAQHVARPPGLPDHPRGSLLIGQHRVKPGEEAAEVDPDSMPF